ncbi:MAG: hypothetical protein E7235_01025 [Lachnospiraceae bacterium]|nr:hypothetical protein [Lachnospiraceae bacterium]
MEDFEISGFMHEVKNMINMTDEVIKALNIAQKALKTSGKLSFINMFSDDFMASALKHTNIIYAEEALLNAQNQLSVMGVGLDNLLEQYGACVDLSDLALAIDLWTDSSIMDHVVHMEIYRAEGQVKSVRNKVRSIRKELASIYNNCKKELENIRKEALMQNQKKREANRIAQEKAESKKELSELQVLVNQYTKRVNSADEDIEQNAIMIFTSINIYDAMVDGFKKIGKYIKALGLDLNDLTKQMENLYLTTFAKLKEEGFTEWEKAQESVDTINKLLNRQKRLIKVLLDLKVVFETTENIYGARRWAFERTRKKAINEIVIGIENIEQANSNFENIIKEFKTINQ